MLDTNFNANNNYCHYYVLMVIQIMRVCLSYFIVEKIRDGMSPQSACEEAIKRLLELKVRDLYDSILSIAFICNILEIKHFK